MTVALRLIATSADLMTSREAMREGFLQQALAKTRQAEPFVVEARQLTAALSGVTDPRDLATVRVTNIRNALIAAAGFSDKARGKFSEAELDAALAAVLERLAKAEPARWREEVVYRFLLTRGDTLGGMMRNLTGAAGGATLASAITRVLEAQGIEPTVTTATKNRAKITSLAWPDRLLVFDRKPRFIEKNIDVILLDTSVTTTGGRLEDPVAYLAAGELKGGIDPAGADEHWKTARTAFERIREKFATHPRRPALFFVGGAIEAAMAGEVFAMLAVGTLDHAANLTKPEQLHDLAEWLTGL